MGKEAENRGDGGQDKGNDMQEERIGDPFDGNLRNLD